MAAQALRGSSNQNTLKPKEKPHPLRWVKRLFIAGLLLVTLGLGLIFYANGTAVWASRGRLFNEVASLPAAKVGLVFGTSDRYKGRENRYFRYRIDAAVKVWNAGKVETLIVSGDNRSEYYNEPQKMKRALIEEGVPAERIVCDYAGLRTFDSVVRAKEVFGADTILVISQRFQNERAIYLAQANGMEAYGFNAEDVEMKAGFKTQLREVGARVKMWLDVNFLNTRPIHAGEKQELPK
ncbi:MAG: YdcF family protein [Armatimonadetes bacterium]|nr:YdcF family protein [Akkermansiaceae bacterium]